MTELMTRPQTREQWLELAVLKLRPLFAEIDVELPNVRVSVGWPSKGGTRSKGKVIGQCWKSVVAADQTCQLFISPILGDDPVQLLGVLAHELIHAWDDCDSGHKGKFARAAKAIGLGGKMTATIVPEGSDLETALGQIIVDLGEYPHSPLKYEELELIGGEKKQGTRMLKLLAECCGYTARTTQKWIDVGLPSCPCGNEMEVV